MLIPRLADAELATMEVANWLRSLGLERYEPVFRENEIDWAVLPELTDADRGKLGLSSGAQEAAQGDWAQVRPARIIAIMDVCCPWPDEANVALADPGEGEVFWDGAISMVALLELMLESVIERLDGNVSERIERLTELQHCFSDFSDACRTI
jgi:hypothetical protein